MKNIMRLKFSGKIILLGIILCLISLPLSWYEDIANSYHSGFDIKSYFILISLFYPAYILSEEEVLDKKVGIISIVVGFVVYFYFLLFSSDIPMIRYLDGATFMSFGLLLNLIGIVITKNSTSLIKTNK